jgi:hypothetical protein
LTILCSLPLWVQTDNAIQIKGCLSNVYVLHSAAYGKYYTNRLSGLPRRLQFFQNAACMQETLMMINHVADYSFAPFTINQRIWINLLMVSVKTKLTSISYSVSLYIVCSDGLNSQRTWQGVQEAECVEFVYCDKQKASH